MRIRDLIHVTDPYAGFDAEKYPAEVQGWGDHRAQFAKLAAQIKPKLVVEIGSWLGKSAITLANVCPDTHVLCIDTWLGAEEMWEDKNDPERYPQLRLANGYPSLYYAFLANIVRAGLQTRITPFPLPSAIALRLLLKWRIRPDLVYIDGSHNYEDVASDIKKVRELSPGIICGDDYCEAWPDVMRAVDDGLPSRNYDDKGFWWG